MAPTNGGRRRRASPSGRGTPVLEMSTFLPFLEAQGIKPINAFRLWKWLIAHPEAESFNEVPWSALEMPAKMEKLVPEHFTLRSSKVASRFDSSDGSTTKLLVELHDGEQVETVLMRHERRVTLCVSSQVGCAMGCTFCATGTMGLRGNLSCAEILEQLVHAGGVEPVRNIVFMGMGEPLHNYDHVLAAMRAMVDVRLWSLRAGHVTISTVGVVSAMKRLTEDMPKVSLALSLHAPTQAIREIIVPTARANRLESIMGALDNHLAKCKKKSSGAVAGMIEYILIAGVNDSPECADLVGELLSSRNVMLNLIPYNDTSNTIAASYGLDFKAPAWEDVLAFQRIVVDRHRVIVRVRREMGADIAGACGQLALTTPVVKAEDRGLTVGPSGHIIPDIEDMVGTSLRPGTSDKSAKITRRTHDKKSKQKDGDGGNIRSSSEFEKSRRKHNMECSDDFPATEPISVRPVGEVSSSSPAKGKDPIGAAGQEAKHPPSVGPSDRQWLALRTGRTAHMSLVLAAWLSAALGVLTAAGGLYFSYGAYQKGPSSRSFRGFIRMHLR